MIIEIKIPSPGESVTEVQLAEWLAEDGAVIEKDAEVAMIDSDKASFALYAEEGGAIETSCKSRRYFKGWTGDRKYRQYSPQSTIHSSQ